MAWIVFTIRLSLAIAVCTPDATCICSGCTQDYFLKSSPDICVGQCPSGYFIDLLAYTCTYPSSTADSFLFDTDFSISIDLTLDTIGVFQNPLGNFQGLFGPIQTVDRGLYFKPAFNLTLTSNPIPSPEFTMYTWVKTIAAGTIFLITGSSQYFKLEVQYGLGYSYQHGLRVCTNPINCSLIIPGLHFRRSLSTGETWKRLLAKTTPLTETTILFSMEINGVFYQSTLYSVNTLYVDIETYVWTIGESGASFEGFIYRLGAYNMDVVLDLPTISPPICDPNYYYSGSACLPCSCTIEPLWCINGVDCSICYSGQCLLCTGYAEEFCIMTSCPDNCITCDDSTHCNLCMNGYFLTSDIVGQVLCSTSMLFTLQSNVLPLNLVSGSVAATYYLNSPDPDDPLAYPCRGFYFDHSNSQFFQSLHMVKFPSSFFIFMWVFPISGTIFTKGSVLEISTSIQTTILLENTLGPTKTLSLITTNPNTWTYLAFKILYSNYYTTIIGYDGTATSTATSDFQYSLQDNTMETLYIGKGTSGYFKGFLALFSILLTTNSDIATYQFITFPCGSLNSCLVYSGELTNCDPCTNCDLCLDSSTSQCTPCETGSFYIGNSCADICYPQFSINNICYDSRGNCFQAAIGLVCNSCNSPFYLYKNICLQICPTGTIVDEINLLCGSIVNPIDPLQLEGKIILSSEGNFFFGSLPDEYPSFDGNDPIPTEGRGYYFKESSYISSTIFLGPDLSIAVWVKLDQMTGEILSKELSGVQSLLLTTSSVKIIASLNDYSLATPSNPDTSNWQYMAIILNFDITDLSTTMKILINQVEVSALTIQNEFWSDEPNNILIIGSKNNFGFLGFLWSVAIYNEAIDLLDYTQVCTGIPQCPLNSLSLGLCEKNFFLLDGTCTSCDSTCNYGCVRTSDCNLCADILCYQCTTFSFGCINCIANASVVDGECLCDNGFFKNLENLCQACGGNCLTCDGEFANNCLTCMVGSLFEPIGMCIVADACPTQTGTLASVVPESNTCVLSSEKVFFVAFGSFQNEFADEVNGIRVFSGSENSFYPNYDPKDPWIAHQRGYYFTSASYVKIDLSLISKLVLSSEFNIGIWANILTNGVLFSRSNPSVYLQISAISNALNISIQTISDLFTVSTLAFTSSKWHLFEVGIQLSSLVPVLTINIDTSINIQKTIDFYKDIIISASTLLGDPISSFTGFIWSFTIFNSYINVEAKNNGIDYYPIDLDSPISDCDIFQFPSANCASCNSNCEYGCKDANGCSLCIDSICLLCENPEICTECFEFSKVVNGVCQCINSFNGVTGACNPILDCYPGCKACSDVSASSCTECNEGFCQLVGYCMLLPTGYTTVNQACKLVSDTTFSITFNAMQGLLYDEYHSVPVITGSTSAFYPDYDYDDPILTPFQGFYFNGISSIIRLPRFSDLINPELILPPTWTIEFYIMPTSYTGCLAISTINSEKTFSFSYNATHVKIDIKLAEALINEIKFNWNLQINSWQVINIVLQYASPNQLSFYVNEEKVGWTALSGTFYQNYNGITTFAFGGDTQEFYQGFLYKISVFPDVKIPTTVKGPDCPIMINGTCLPECSISEYWVGPDKKNCSACEVDCQSCRTDKTCNLCSDPLCGTCSDFGKFSCTECSANSNNLENCKCDPGSLIDYLGYSCTTCKENQYYNQITCVDCPVLCKACQANKCYSCVENAELSNDFCTCGAGYNGTSCTPAFFSVGLKVNSDNSIFLDFADPLLKTLEKKDLEIFLTKSSLNDFSLSKWTDSRYYIVLIILDNIPSDCYVNISFSSPSKILSIYNSKLLENSLSDLLISSDKLFPKNSLISELEASSKTVTISLTSSNIVFSLSSQNPAFLWSFISSIQFLCFISFSDIDLSPRFKGFLKGLRKYNLFPNLFEYFVPHTGGEKPFQRAYEFGYSDDLILFNSGNFFCAFLFMMCLWLIFFIFSKLTHKKPFSNGFIKKKIEESLASYKYDAFLRFWITCYLDLLAAAFIAFAAASQTSWQIIMNCIFATGILVKFYLDFSSLFSDSFFDF